MRERAVAGADFVEYAVDRRQAGVERRRPHCAVGGSERRRLRRRGDEVGGAAAGALAVGPPHEEVADTTKRRLLSVGCVVRWRGFVARQARLRRRRVLRRCVAAGAGGVASGRRRRRRRRAVASAGGVACGRRRRRRRSGRTPLPLLRRRRRRGGVVGVVVAVCQGCGVSRGFGAVCGSAQAEVRGAREVENLAGLDVPVHELVAVHVVGEEVGKVHEVAAERVEFGRFCDAQAPVGASSVRFRQGGDEHGVSISCMYHPGGLAVQDANVTCREADLLAHFSERGRVRSFAAFSAAAEVLPDAVGSAYEGAVFAHDEDTGAWKSAVGSGAVTERGV